MVCGLSGQARSPPSSPSSGRDAAPQVAAGGAADGKGANTSDLVCTGLQPILTTFGASGQQLAVLLTAGRGAVGFDTVSQVRFFAEEGAPAEVAVSAEERAAFERALLGKRQESNMFYWMVRE